MTFFKQRGINISRNNNEIVVDSEKYSSDKAYSDSIDNKLNKLFSNDINPTK